MHVKGLELPMHDPRAYPSMAVSYALGSRGGDHLEGMSYMYEKGLRIPNYGYQGELDPRSHEHKAQLAHENINYYATFNALGLCKFISIGQASLEMICGWISKVTGWDVDTNELLTAGERLINAKRLYNLARGVTSEDDILPPRLMQPQAQGCVAEGVVLEAVAPDVPARIVVEVIGPSQVVLVLRNHVPHVLLTYRLECDPFHVLSPSLCSSMIAGS